MMKDVDALTRQFGKDITLHCMQAHLMCSRDKLHRPLAYDFDQFHTAPKVNHILPSSTFLINPQPPLPSVSAALEVLPSKPSVVIPSSIPVLFHSAIRLSRSPSHSIIPPVTQRREPSYAPFTGHQSLVWISIYAIIPTVGCIIAAWPGKRSDHHVFESTRTTNRTAQVAATDATVHLLTIPQLVTHLLSVTDTNTNSRYCASAIESSSSCHVSGFVKESHIVNNDDLVSRSSISSVGDCKVESSRSNFGCSINESHVGSHIGGFVIESHVVHNGDNFGGSITESHIGSNIGGSVTESHVVHNGDNLGGSINESYVVDNGDLPCESSVISVGASTIEASGSNIGGSVTESHVVHNDDLLLGSHVLSVGEL